jgi:2-(1,2-epoxy-1,2-dihydrophenyl)acetyl-CoA isomerase
MMETILVTDDAGVRTITLNRPDAMNAATEQMLSELNGTLKDTAKDKSVRCLVLTATGRAFCVGQDIGLMKSKFETGETMDFATLLRKGYNAIIEKMNDLEIPVIASINGVAAGAGWSLALAADMRIASDKAAFVAAFSKIGVIPDSGFTQTLPRLVGLARALEIVWMNDKISAEQALAWGLVNKVVPADQLAATTIEMAAQLAQCATRALGMTKRAMIAAFENDLAAQLELEAQLQAAAGATRDHREGVAAFLEKRAPVFTGE